MLVGLELLDCRGNCSPDRDLIELWLVTRAQLPVCNSHLNQLHDCRCKCCELLQQNAFQETMSSHHYEIALFGEFFSQDLPGNYPLPVRESWMELTFDHLCSHSEQDHAS